MNRARLVRLLRVAKRAGVPIPAHLEILFVNDPTIRRLNRQFLRHDRPTDVLAFGLGAQPGVRGAWAQIVISLDTAARQAKRFHQPFQRECARYVIHGLLHLAGYDDHLHTNRAVMSRREEDLLTQVENRRASPRARRSGKARRSA